MSIRSASDERELVAAGLHAARPCAAPGGARRCRRRVGVRSDGRGHGGRRGQQGADVDAGERRRHQAEVATGPSSGRRCRAGSRTWPGSRGRRPASPAPLPGSVTTAKCAGVADALPETWRGGCGSRWWSPTSTRRRTACVSGGSSCPTRATAAGSVVSSTCSRRPWLRVGNDRASTSGNRLEPPMPMTTHVVDALGQPARADEPRRSARPAISPATSSQPSRSAISVGSSCQSVWSRAQRRRTASRAARSASAVGGGLASRDPSRIAGSRRAISRSLATSRSRSRVPSPVEVTRRRAGTSAVRSRARDRCRSTVAGPGVDSQVSDAVASGVEPQPLTVAVEPTPRSTARPELAADGRDHGRGHAADAGSATAPTSNRASCSSVGAGARPTTPRRGDPGVPAVKVVDGCARHRRWAASS